MRIQVIEQSQDLISIAPGWLTSSWAIAECHEVSKCYPLIWAKAELFNARDMVSAGISEIRLLGNRTIKPQDIRHLSQIVTNLASEVLSLVTTIDPTSATAAVPPSVDDWNRALRRSMRNTHRYQRETEDAALHAWENLYQPKGMNQSDAAHEMGLTYSTFRTYLCHARSRRST